MKQILLSLMLIVLIAGCESREEKKHAQQIEQFKQEQLAQVSGKTVKEADKNETAPAERARPKVEKSQSVPVKETEQNTTGKTEEPSVLNKMGMSMEDGKLIIDTNRAKEFFWQLQQRLDNTSREIDREIREGNLSITVPAGVEIQKERVTIDLNKTRRFFESWGGKMEDFAREFDKMTKSLYENNQTEK